MLHGMIDGLCITEMLYAPGNLVTYRTCRHAAVAGTGLFYKYAVPTARDHRQHPFFYNHAIAGSMGLFPVLVFIYKHAEPDGTGSLLISGFLQAVHFLS